MEAIISLNDKNIEEQHICCAFANKKTADGYHAKKEWLKSQFAEGYQFKKFDIRGKVFIEYVPAEKAWAPIEAPNYMMINCFWVSGKYKGRGYGTALFEECLKDSQDKDGLVVLTGSKKKPFMSDKKFFIKKGFQLADTAKPYFELWYKPLKPNSKPPQFKPVCKEGLCDNKSGITVYYTNSCPFTEYYVNSETVAAAKALNIDIVVKKIESREQAQQHFVPFTIHSLFFNGQFITQQILTQKHLTKLVSEQFQ